MSYSSFLKKFQNFEETLIQFPVSFMYSYLNCSLLVPFDAVSGGRNQKFEEKRLVLTCRPRPRTKSIEIEIYLHDIH